MGINNTILLFHMVYKGDSDVVVHSSSVLAGHVHFLNRFAFSQDGQYLATPSNDRSIRIWDLQAALQRNQVLRYSEASDDAFDLCEAWIDNDGWVVCANRDGGNAPRRLIWIPDVHRNGLYLSSNVRVVKGEKETRLGLERFVHGKNWDKCWLGLKHS
jgi:WD40 repeat protein